MNFDLARHLTAILISRDFKQMNKTEIAPNCLEIYRERLQRNTIGKPGSDFKNPSWTLTYNNTPLAAVSRSRDFQQINKTEKNG